ncbi:MAG: hypothetical protein JW822_08425 [Spirochaetales bacterium]|nr:hypothetical protein [Spirochaetales bacterium]
MNKVLSWLLAGDVSIQYLTHRDLLRSAKPQLVELQNRIATEGWGKRFLAKQKRDGHWGRGYYQPKWISTHYTLLDLKNLGISRRVKQIKTIVEKIFTEKIDHEGSVNYSTKSRSDVCINGMVLNIASYFLIPQKKLQSIIDYLLTRQLADGAWNCVDYKGAHHSSLHTTISVLEGLLEYKSGGYDYKIKAIEEAERKAVEFILKHSLYKSHRTAALIDKRFLMLSYPSRWRYDILRALDYFQAARIKFDSRMNAALDILQKKQRKDGTWPLQMKHLGQVHFDMEETGGPSRWNSLRALRVLEYYEQKDVKT